ncbi:MAG: hypothetical protein DRI89_02675 [Bacteroidetes bacterium]|nr:MAG: hypothetical protein DRI89_02675 [Bacteroidota bacterium]
MKKFFLLRTVFILIALFFLKTTFSQKIERVSGEATVRMETLMTETSTRERAKELAIVNALENAFGTYVEQQMDMTISEGKTAYNIIGSTKVKGDWIETTSINYSKHEGTEKGFSGDWKVSYVTCEIKGKARKHLPRANIEFEVLNSPTLASRTENFYDGEQLYLFFKSPVSGYLSVYLDDGTTVFRLLPDTYSPVKFESGVFVNGDQEYLFFSSAQNNLPQSDAEEYLMFSNKIIEYNFIYIIFSEEKFVKPYLQGIEEQDKRTLPKSLSSERFQKWLSANRAALPAFQDRKIKISIQQKNE